MQTELKKMRISKTIMACMCIMLTTSSVSLAQGWRGIVPLHSTCEDVKQQLGVTKCDADSTYNSEDETITVTFSEKPCHEKWPYETWNVPPGTVTSVIVNLKKQPPMVALNIDIEKYKKAVDEYSTGGYIYYSEEEGTTITVDGEGKALELHFLPAKRDNHLRCPGASVGMSGVGKKSADAALILDKYGDIDFNKEEERLDNFARQLSQYGSKMQGYIIAYGGRRSHVGEAQTRARRAKNYLVNKHSIEAERIVTVDGGYCEESTVELWISVRGTAALVAFPTVHPNEVQIINDDNRKVNKRRQSRERHKQHQPYQ